MVKLKSKKIIKILKENRKKLNAITALESFRNPDLKIEEFMNYFIEIAEPLSECRKADEEKLENSVLALFEKILSLYSRGFFGNTIKFPYLEVSFKKILTGFDNVFLDKPVLFISTIVNAVVKLSGQLGEKINSWVGCLLLFKEYDLAAIKQIGFVLAWKSGIARYRKHALELCKNLKSEILCKIFNTDISAQIIQRMEKDPWYNPEEIEKKEKPELRLLGGFEGFNGKFVKPPNVFLCEGGIVVADGINCHLVYADIYGQELMQINNPATKISNTKSLFKIGNSFENISYKNKQYNISKIYNTPVKSHAAINNTVCITSEFSHFVFIVGIREQE